MRIVAGHCTNELEYTWRIYDVMYMYDKRELKRYIALYITLIICYYERFIIFDYYWFAAYTHSTNETRSRVQAAYIHALRAMHPLYALYNTSSIISNSSGRYWIYLTQYSTSIVFYVVIL